MPQDIDAGAVVVANIARVAPEHVVRLSRHVLAPGDVVFSRRGDVRRFAIIGTEEEGWLCGTGCLRLRIGDAPIVPGYLRWFFAHDAVGDWLERNAQGATMPNLNTMILSRLPLRFPPLPEQRRIAAILDKADAIRRKRREAIAITEELLRSTFLEMFGDPVTNPKGWPEHPLSFFGTITTGNTPSRKVPENYGNHIEWIETDNITGSSDFLTAAAERLSIRGHAAGRIVPDGSVLMACIAGSLSSIGKVAIADRPVAFNQQINAIVPDGENVSLPFLYALLKFGQKRVQAISTGGMKGLVSKGRLTKLMMMMPPVDRQRQFDPLFGHCLTLKGRCATGEAQADVLFHSLVQRAFRGDL
jgi:type I restriction enzyme, S subunit